MTRIVYIKFCQAGRHYHFLAENLDLTPGEQVVVETARGRALGTVAAPIEEISETEVPKDLKQVVRKASDEDIRSYACFKTKEQEAFQFCRRRIEERAMPMKLVRAEYLFDGSKIIFYFTSDGRVDFRELVKDLAHQLHTRIEMKQIGVRDEAKLVGGIGICGRELCCCSFLSEFSPVSVKMAKEQGLALNPAKISGQCGRLLCCLSYEFSTYLALKKGFPKPGSRSVINGKNVLVIDTNFLTGKITLKTEDNQTLNVSLEDFERGETKPLTSTPPILEDTPVARDSAPEPKATPETPKRIPPPKEPKTAGPSRPNGPEKRAQDRNKGRGARPQPQPVQGKQQHKQARPPQPQQQPQAAPLQSPSPPAVEGGGEQTKKRPNRRRRKNRTRPDDQNDKN